MDGVFDSISSSSLKFELRIMEVKNIELQQSSNLFVRCYLSAGNDSKIELNSKEISSKSDKLVWDECFSLDCAGDSLIKTLKQSELVFELRKRDTTRSVFKKLKSSKLVGRVEVAWETVFESTDMKMEQWFPCLPKKNSEGAKLGNHHQQPMIRIGMGIQVPVMSVSRTTMGRATKPRKWNECGSKDGGCCCIDDDYLLVLDASMFLATCDL